MLHQSAELLELTLNTNVVQVTNVAPATTLEQMQTLFGFLGKIEEIKLYPLEECPLQSSPKVCYVRYVDKTSVGVAQHLTNTVFIDRALIVVPVADGIIPDEAKAIAMISPSSSMSGLMNSSQSQVVNQVVSGVGGTQVISTIDPHLTALGLPQYPPLPANMDPSKIEEIRRTVYVGNLDSALTAEQLLKFFNQIGEVKYVRMAGDETQPTRFAFVEFTEQSSVSSALQYNGVIYYSRPLKINHSNNAIVKPQAKSSEAAQREIEEAMKRVREAQSLITAAIEPVLLSELAEKEKKRDRSRSRSRSHSRIRSLSRSRRRSRSPSHSHHRSRSGKRSRSRSRHRSPGHRSHSRKRSSSPTHRSASKSHRSRSRDRVKKRSRSHSRSKSPSKKRASRSSKTKSSSRPEGTKEKEKSPKEEKKKELNETQPKEDIDDRFEQTIIPTESKEKILPETLVEVEQEKLFSQNQDIDLRIEAGNFNICTDLPVPITTEVVKDNQSDDQDTVDTSSRKESEEKLKKRPRSRTPSKYSSSTKSSSKYRSSRSPSRKKSSHSPSRRKHSPSRHKPSHSPSRRKSSRSPSSKKSSRSPSRSKVLRSPGRHRHSRSPSRTLKRRSRSPKRTRSKRSPATRHRSRSPSYRSSRSPGHRRRHSSRSPSRWSRSPRRRSRSRSVRRESKHKRKDSDHGRDKDRKKKKEESKESKVKRDYDEEEKGFDSSPNHHGPKLPGSSGTKKKAEYPKIETKNSDSEGTDHKPGDMDLDSD